MAMIDGRRLRDQSSREAGSLGLGLRFSRLEFAPSRTALIGRLSRARRRRPPGGAARRIVQGDDNNGNNTNNRLNRARRGRHSAASVSRAQRFDCDPRRRRLDKQDKHGRAEKLPPVAA